MFLLIFGLLMVVAIISFVYSFYFRHKDIKFIQDLLGEHICDVIFLACVIAALFVFFNNFMFSDVEP